jgi:hypothetical protein
MLLKLEDLVLESDKIEAREHHELVLATNRRLCKRTDKDSWSVIQRFEDIPHGQHVSFVMCLSAYGGN